MQVGGRTGSGHVTVVNVPPLMVVIDMYVYMNLSLNHAERKISYVTLCNTSQLRDSAAAATAIR